MVSNLLKFSPPIFINTTKYRITGYYRYGGTAEVFKLKWHNKGIDNEGKYFLILLPLTLHKINPPRHIKLEQTADIALGTCPTTF